jgi:hypothetical protein
MSLFDFNDAEDFKTFEPIPHGTLAKVKLIIQPGGYNDLLKGYSDGLATLSKTGAVYLKCEFVVQGGEYDKRKIWSMIGLHSPKGPEYHQMGRSFIKSILNSANGLFIKDISEAAQKKRTLIDLGALNNLIFVARIDITEDEKGRAKNEIRVAITPDDSNYQRIMGGLADDEIPF